MDKRSIDRERERLTNEADYIRGRCRTLAGFVREAWHVLHPATPYVHNWHIDLICAHLEAVTHGTLLARGFENRLRFNVPPGSLKSFLIDVFWQAWEWGPCQMPHTQWLTSTYREDYAIRDSRRTRDLVNSEWYRRLWGHVFELTSDGERRFENNHRGFRWAVPFASLTAGRGDRVIIDDPHSVDTAESDTERAAVTRRFRESVPHRVNDPRASAIVVIMQRLHANDVSGAIEALRLPYVSVVLPMEFEADARCITPLGRDPRTYDGELFFPERWSREVIERMKGEMTAYAVASQFQQRPTPRQGGLFKREWFDIVPAVPAGARRVRGWDLAATKDKGNGSVSGPAYTVGVRMSEHNGTFYVEHVVRLRGSPADVERAIVATAKQDTLTCDISIPQDPGQAGKSQVATFAKRLAGFNARFSPESGDKVLRAGPFAAQAEVGNVKLVFGEWNEAYLEELALAPAGAFMDQVDASSRAFAHLIATQPQDNGVGIAAPIQVGAGPRMRI
jgi:predicted phage terminase large subunit-like protein